MSTLSSLALLSRLSISAWTARKKDQKITREVNAAHGARRDAGQYNKVLISKARLAGIQRSDSALREYHNAQTLPWEADGIRIIPNVAVLAYEAKVRELIAAREQEVRAFLSGYPDAILEARATLNGMFDAADYPSRQELASRYSVTLALSPVPDGRDFRADLPDEVLDRMREDVDARGREAMAAAMRDVWERLYKVVAAIHNRTKRAPGTDGAGFQDSLIGNLADLLDLLPSLNLSKDPGLDALAAEARARLLVDPKVLKNNTTAREDTARASRDILRRMAAYCGPMADDKPTTTEEAA